VKCKNCLIFTIVCISSVVATITLSSYGGIEKLYTLAAATVVIVNLLLDQRGRGRYIRETVAAALIVSVGTVTSAHALGYAYELQKIPNSDITLHVFAAISSLIVVYALFWKYTARRITRIK